MKQNTIQHLPIDQIVSRPQVRRDFDEVALAELAASIKESGVQQPIHVQRDGEHFTIVTGERRWRASTLAGLTTMPAIVHDDPLSDVQLLQLQLVENLQRANLRAREKSDAIQRLLNEAKLTVKQIALKLGLSTSTISKLAALAGLPVPILAGVDAGTISLSAAYELSQISDPVRQAELAAQSAAGTLNRDALASAKRLPKAAASDSTKPSSRSRFTAMLDAYRFITFVGSGLDTLEHLIAWLEELLSKARKARLHTLALDTFMKMLRDQARA